MDKYFEEWDGKKFPVRVVVLPEELGGFAANVADYELWAAIKDDYDADNAFAVSIDNGVYYYCDVIERNKIDAATACVGYGDHKHTKAADNVLKKVLRDLDKDGYVIMTKACLEYYKGRFKSTTYYLAEE